MHEIVMHWNYPGKKFLRKQFLLNHQKHFDTNQGVFRKEETKGYLNMNLKIGVTNVDYVWMSMNKPIKYTLNFFSQVHQVF